MRVFWACGVVALIFMGIGNVHSADRAVDTETRCVFDLVVNQDEKLRFFKEAKAFAEEHSLFFLEKKLPWFVWEKQTPKSPRLVTQIFIGEKEKELQIVLYDIQPEEISVSFSTKVEDLDWRRPMNQFIARLEHVSSSVVRNRRTVYRC